MEANIMHQVEGAIDEAIKWRLTLLENSEERLRQRLHQLQAAKVADSEVDEIMTRYRKLYMSPLSQKLEHFKNCLLGDQKLTSYIKTVATPPLSSSSPISSPPLFRRTSCTTLETRKNISKQSECLRAKFEHLFLQIHQKNNRIEQLRIAAAEKTIDDHLAEIQPLLNSAEFELQQKVEHYGRLLKLLHKYNENYCGNNGTTRKSYLNEAEVTRKFTSGVLAHSDDNIEDACDRGEEREYDGDQFNIDQRFLKFQQHTNEIIGTLEHYGMSSTTLWDPYDSPETLLRDELYIQQTDMNGGVDDCGEDHCITGSTNTPRISFHSHSLNQNELKVEQHSKTHSQEKPACTSTVEKTLQRESDLQRLTCSVAPLPQDAYRGIQFRLKDGIRRSMLKLF